MRDDSGVAGEGKFVGVPKFHSWGKCIMLSMFNASSGLCINLLIYITRVLYFASWGVN